MVFFWGFSVVLNDFYGLMVLGCFKSLFDSHPEQIPILFDRAIPSHQLGPQLTWHLT